MEPALHGPRIAGGVACIVGHVPHCGGDRALHLVADGPLVGALECSRIADGRVAGGAGRPSTPQRSGLDVVPPRRHGAGRKQCAVIDKVRNHLGPPLAPRAPLVVLEGVPVRDALVRQIRIVHCMHVVRKLVQYDSAVERVVAGRAGRAVEPHDRGAGQVGGTASRFVGEDSGPACAVPLDEQGGRLVAEPLEKGHAVGQGANDAGRPGHAAARNIDVVGVQAPGIVGRQAGVISVAVKPVPPVLVRHEIYKPAVPARNHHNDHVGPARAVRVGAGNAQDVVPPASVGVGAGRLAGCRVQYRGELITQEVARQIDCADLDAVHGHGLAPPRKAGGRDVPGRVERGVYGRLGERGEQSAARHGGRRRAL